MTTTPLPEQILRAMARLASRGEVDVHPSRIADLISPRPSLGAMTHALLGLWEDGLIDDGRIGQGRYRLAPAPWAGEPEELRMEV